MLMVIEVIFQRLSLIAIFSFFTDKQRVVEIVIKKCLEDSVNGGADSESEDSNSITSDPLFLELLKDENDGLAVWYHYLLHL